MLGLFLGAVAVAIVLEHVAFLVDRRETRRQARSDRQYFWVG